LGNLHCCEASINEPKEKSEEKAIIFSFLPSHPFATNGTKVQPNPENYLQEPGLGAFTRICGGELGCDVADVAAIP
jgi:hypothetical protein